MPMRSPEIEAKLKAYEREREAWESKLKFELRAVGSIGGVAVAIIDIDGQPQAATPGSHLLRWVVERIDPQNKTAVLTQPGQPDRALTLTHASEAASLMIERENQILLMNKANPETLMKISIRRFQEYPLMPREVEAAWGRLDRDSKEAILVNYLTSGIVMSRVIEPNGTGRGGASLLFGRQISERRRQGLQRFMGSLTPAQREKYHHGAMGVINFTVSAAEQKKQSDRAKAMAKDQAEVVAGLTAEQRKLYDALQEWAAPPLSARH
jgi:hypothetical protein